LLDLPVHGAEERICREVAKLPGVTSQGHRFGGTEFRTGRRELGHIHGDYQADIPFPMDVRNRLVAEGKAEPHHIFSRSGWITLRFREPGDVERAIGLFKLAYDLASQKAQQVQVQRG
jgi:hypothetical protein